MSRMPPLPLKPFKTLPKKQKSRIWGVREVSPYFPLFPYVGIGARGRVAARQVTLVFLMGLKAGSHPRAFLDPVGFILCEYDPKPSHMDPYPIRPQTADPCSGPLQGLSGPLRVIGPRAQAQGPNPQILYFFIFERVWGL